MCIQGVSEIKGNKFRVATTRRIEQDSTETDFFYKEIKKRKILARQIIYYGSDARISIAQRDKYVCMYVLIIGNNSSVIVIRLLHRNSFISSLNKCVAQRYDKSAETRNDIISLFKGT